MSSVEIPTRDEIKVALGTDVAVSAPSNDLEMERAIHQLDREKATALIALTERQELIKMRSGWSKWILIVIVAISVFDMCLILGIGLKWLVYENAYAVPFFIGESLIKLLGLAFLIVHFLFNHKSLAHSKEDKSFLY